MKLILKVSILFISLFLLIGCNPNESDHTETDVETENKTSNTVDENDTEPIEYIPGENDVLYKDHAMDNKDLLDAFIMAVDINNEQELRVVKYDEGGAMIYDLLSRYDENTDTGWIEVTPDLTYYNKAEYTVEDIFNHAPQQCASLTVDTEKDIYTFNECRTHREYPFIPIVNTTLSGEEIEDSSESGETPEIVMGNEYYLDDSMTEVFLSKKDAEEWLSSFNEEDEEQIEEVTLDNIVKLLRNQVELDRVTDQPVRVISCESGICEVYSEATFQLKVFAIPEMWINLKERVQGIEEIPNQESPIDEVTFWKEMNERLTGILEDSTKLIELYQTADIFEADKETRKNLYHRVDGNTIIIQYTTPPAISSVEEKYYEILIHTGFLFNALHQAEIYIENGEVDNLAMQTINEIIPLRDELAGFSKWISELDDEK